MAVMTSSLVHQPKIDKALKKVLRALQPDVVRIRYSLEDNFMGDPSIFFRVLLSDEAAKEHHLHEKAQRAMRLITEAVDPHELRLESYFNYRSVSEQEELRNPIWD